MRVNDIFRSIAGEPCFFHQGRISTFIRLQGCNLDCKYPCDTPQARNPERGLNLSLSHIKQQIEYLGIPYITITGGEPLLQWGELRELLAEFPIDCNYIYSIETNGSIKRPATFRNIFFVIDWKCPSSKETEKMDFDNLINCLDSDFIKFVVKDEIDFHYASRIMEEIKRETSIINFIFSPVYGILDPKMLFGWMMDYEVPGILGLQLHKIVGIK